MMLQARGVFFGETQKALALALYEAGQTDREIADAIPTSVNNISWWRKEVGLMEHRSAGPEPEAYSAPTVREPITRSAPAPRPVTPALLTPAAAQIAYAAPVQPAGDNALEIGTNANGKVFVDLQEMLTTRLLVQGNSGSGKSHLLRRVLEESTGIVQQIVIDPEGDFVSFGETFGYTVVNAIDQKPGRMASIAARARQHRGSVVVNLEGVDPERRMDDVSAFLNGLFDAPREHWCPALVVVDEAHLFAPSTNSGENPETRKACLQAMTDLMSRGRKRGLAGLIATQRLAKLHKNVAAEASNFLMGRTFLDIDIARAADLLGMERRQADDIRNLNRGEFLGLGPAISRRPLKVTIGGVMTMGKDSGEQGLVPLPSLSADELQALMLADDEPEEAPARPALRVVS